MHSELYFQTSPWWVVVCLAVGVAYAYGLYQPNRAWSLQQALGLSLLRFIIVSVICFLFLNPLIRSVQTVTEPPKVVLAIDNSESMAVAGRLQLDSVLAATEHLRAQLAEEGVDVRVQTLGDSVLTGPISGIKFNRRSTDLTALLGGIRTAYEGRNLTDVILISDGIVNQGVSPTFGPYNFLIQAVGVGDTIPKRDVQIKDVIANKIAYLGNIFPIQADIVSTGLQGTGIVVLRQNGKELNRQTINFNRSETFQQVTFQTSSNQKGVQHYVVEVIPQQGEYTSRNNYRDVYIDIIDGKEKILLLALAPHPDIKALRTIIEKNENYELDSRILSAGPVEIPNKAYDLLILHQLPDNMNTGAPVVQRMLQKNMPVLFVLGNQSRLQLFNGLNSVMQIMAGDGQTDRVTGRINPEFGGLTLDLTKLNLVDKLPPISVPFGEYRLQPGSEVVLWQQIGGVQTSKPLLALNKSATRKSAVLVGEGLWEWRLEEYALTNNQIVIDELFQKLIQLVSVKEDRRKLRVYPLRNEFLVGEKVVFETEMYNDIYERLYKHPVRLEITNEKLVTQSYTYTPIPNTTRFEISGYPKGVYRFRATASLDRKTEVVAGEFIVREQELEALNTTANYLLLRQLARQTGGQFYHGSALSTLANDLTKEKLVGRLSSREELNELINLRWLFFLILFLAGLEWGLRKYHGTY